MESYEPFFSSQLFFYFDNFHIKQPTKVDMALNTENETESGLQVSFKYFIWSQQLSWRQWS